ncbi:MAG TPA: multiheme c-type cytochrome [Gemmatimonadota bacterium]|nr:multiheme c-type cytochrome [Gemmatimonadota bacterium]
MRHHQRPRLPSALPTLFALVLASGCTDRVTIFKETPFFAEPPAAANGYLGYDEEDTKLTVCGNCHVGQQASWEKTHHADAFATLEATGHANDTCRACHSVDERGNAATDSGGWETTKDVRYQDVQCESCHGPGAAHIENPDASQPLASLAVGTDLTNGCGECHQGTHHGFVDEWAQSPHAQVVAYPASQPDCQRCHRGQNVLLAWGENADYVERFSPEPLPIVCGVCHDPHGTAPYGHQLRFPVNTNSIEDHLCAQCHNRRTAPDASSAHGLEPHSPESALLMGDAGWFPPGASIDQGQIRGTHGSERNAELCATCHLPSFEVTDPATGDHTFSVTGHLFRPIPCLDENGVPTGFPTDCALTADARSFKGCTASGCHGDEQAAASALNTAVVRIQPLADQLRDLLTQVDPNLEEAGGEIDPENPTFTVAEGAFFNLSLAEFGQQTFGTNTVVGSSVHNPFLVEALLLASIDQVQTTYGVMASPDIRARLRSRLKEIRTQAIR